MTPRDIDLLGDKAIAFVSILLFLASVVILYFIARRLFDQRLALIACGLVLICDTHLAVLAFGIAADAAAVYF